MRETRSRYCSLVEAEYRAHLDQLVRLTPVSACTPLLGEACHNAETKELIIHSMLPTIFQYAMLICPRDPMDLVSVGNLALLAHFEQAMREEVPLRYLFNRARMAMFGYIRQYRHGPITFPDSGEHQAPTYSFLHIFDHLDTEDIVEPDSSPPAPFDASPLYEALASLKSEEARELVARLFGLFERPMESLLEVTGERDWNSAQYRRVQTAKYVAMQKLKAYLIQHYPDFVEAHACANLSEKVQAKAYARLYEIGTIPAATRKRLDESRKRIEARGDPLTLKWLRIEAACGSAAAQAYLYEWRIADEQRRA